MELLTKIIEHIEKLELSKFNIGYGIHKIGVEYCVSLTKDEKYKEVIVDKKNYKDEINEAVSLWVETK